MLSENRHCLLLAAVVLSTLGACGLALVGVVWTVGTLIGGGPLLPTLAAFVLGTFLLVALAVVSAVALVREVARRASLPKSRRVARLLRVFEVILPPLSALGLADRVEPPTPTFDERRDVLTQRYVDGDLSEDELERELDVLLTESASRS